MMCFKTLHLSTGHGTLEYEPRTCVHHRIIALQTALLFQQRSFITARILLFTLVSCNIRESIEPKEVLTRTKRKISRGYSAGCETIRDDYCDTQGKQLYIPLVHSSMATPSLLRSVDLGEGEEDAMADHLASLQLNSPPSRIDAASQFSLSLIHI